MQGNPHEDERLDWSEETTRRYDGYTYFGDHPEVMLDRSNEHMPRGLAWGASECHRQRSRRDDGGNTR